MDNKITERETHDLMNVESFSQLPFIRPAPPPIKEKGIRLFGIEFGGNGAAAATTTTDDSESAETTTNNNNINAFEVETNKDNHNNNNSSTTTTENNIESNRRFECHYCCRNFPTSQALGGHQNAHKRERQHAKRAHLQSTMVHAGTFSSDPHLYHHHHHHHHPLINYRFASSSSSSPTSPMPSYPTWNSNSSARFYGTHQAASSTYNSQPINGSPLAFWRVPNGTVQSNPSFNHERSFQNHLPLLASEERVSSQVGLGPSVASQNRYVYDSSKRSDHVSLDLHL